MSKYPIFACKNQPTFKAMLSFVLVTFATSFSHKRIHHRQHRSSVTIRYKSSNKFENDIIVANDKSEEVVPVGSQDYYSGFFTRDLRGENDDRVTGDALLGPTMKFVGYSVAVLVFFFVGFLISNDLI